MDGTTDVTRTFYFGSNETADEEKKKKILEMRDRYTRVLLGNLDLERIVFPDKGISGG